ncbi:hypothetical protein Cgig2_022599 [Carnegiea gigantea]|uniref:Aminotransferase-like plant mobile domain-containing protein n=1 Tax=Carnegiea gigantea TaxID=171969 RepID=A0A9Q1GYG1_9CARY|nr:hypothetical protein Cgig2_022599 [Carnegiea gigantea]
MLKFLAKSYVTSSLILTSILLKKVRIKQGTLHYHQDDQNKCVDVSKDYENYFNATVFEKVDTERCGGEGYPAEDQFYPALHRLLTRRRNWGPLNFYDKKPLKQAGIFDVVGAYQFSHHFDANIWRAFCELWGPLTNTLHHRLGEVGISLYDLERIGGLPVLGAIYEEFLPPNTDLANYNKYPITAVELLHIHAKLCKFHNVGHIYYDLWLDHFYREYFV